MYCGPVRVQENITSEEIPVCLSSVQQVEFVLLISFCCYEHENFSKSIMLLPAIAYFTFQMLSSEGNILVALLWRWIENEIGFRIYYLNQYYVVFVIFSRLKGICSLEEFLYLGNLQIIVKFTVLFTRRKITWTSGGPCVRSFI